jgi:hypothetical protein
MAALALNTPFAGEAVNEKQGKNKKPDREITDNSRSGHVQGADSA